MKKNLLSFCILIFLSVCGKAQYVTIPDNSFRNFLIGRYPDCFNTAGLMDTTCSSIINETGLQPDFANDLTGIRYFKRLRTLTLRYVGLQVLPALPDSLTRLISIDAVQSFAAPLPATLEYFLFESGQQVSLPTPLPPALTYLNIDNSYYINLIPALPANLDTLIVSGTAITTLPTLPGGLKYLDCSNDSIALLPSLPTSLKYLACNSTKLSALPVLPAGLKYLSCNSNQAFGTLPTLPATLQYLDCSNNILTVLPTLPAGLTTLNCSQNPLGVLEAMPASLKSLTCSKNLLSVLPTLPNELNALYCSDNSLHSLPRLPDSLTRFDCNTDSLSVLPTLPFLQYFGCSNNLLTSLPALPPSLITLSCDNNRLTSLPALPATLRSLTCNVNQLTVLPDLPTFLNRLDCINNRLTSLPALPESNDGFTSVLIVNCYKNNIYCLPKIPDNAVIAMDDKLSCIPNRATSTWIDFYDEDFNHVQRTLPLCNPTNNVNQCQSFPIVSGHVFYDYNNNGTREANELFRAGVGITLSNGTSTFTNSDGYFETTADSLISYTVTAIAPEFYNILPASVNYNFTRFDTVVIKEYALQANATVDSMLINITPTNWASRPGFSYPYRISYVNVGTTTLNPTISFNYDNTRLILDSVSNPAVINTGGNLTVTQAGFLPGASGNFTAYFRIRATAVIGDSLRSNATIIAGIFLANSTLNVLINGSFDPNDKQATPELSPAQVAAGDYINYTIRFQNTGTDTAFNIVLTDTLNSELQPATLQMLESSHNCKTTVKGNVIYFEFLDILLADSNVNEPKSHGFVTFRIKPQPNVAINSSIPNKAAIYFDYNAPVITNTALTLIRNPVIEPVPLNLMAFTATKQTDRTATAYWTTANEINVRRFIIEQSIDGRNFTMNIIQTASGRSYNSYSRVISIPLADIIYLRLKMEDIDGHFTYSPVVVLKKHQSAEAFTILNNPVKGNMVIALQDDRLMNTQASIINAQGVIVKTFLLRNNQQTISTDNLPAGVYILKTEQSSTQFILTK